MAEGVFDSIISALFGSKKPEPPPAEPKPTFYPAEPNRSWPTDDDVATSVRYDQSYGSPHAAYFQPGDAKINEIPERKVVSTLNSNLPMLDFNQRANNPQIADALHRQWLASNRSPVASLGFDPHHMTSTMPSKGHRWGNAGEYHPGQDAIWSNRNYESTPVHESMHRGMEMLRKAGINEGIPSRDAEEYVVRALMNRYFGDVERGRGSVGDQQINSALSLVKPEMMDSVEKAAADLIAKRNPRGPR